jgi:hypothetical protein
VQFNLDISLGNVLTILSILGVAVRVLSVLEKFNRVIWEHDILWRRYIHEHPELQEVKRGK